VYRHVLCISPYRRTRRSVTSFPPLGLEYIAAALRPYAQRMDLINYRHERNPVASRFIQPDTDLICYSINWAHDIEFIRDDINSLPPGVMTILGGRTATEDPRYWMEACPNVDAVVCGDGERTIVEIAEGRPWEEIAGLVRRDGRGGLTHTPPRANAPLDEDLIPARDLRRKPYYLTTKGISTGIKIDKIAASRGCPYNCKFCSFAINPWGVKRSWSPRSAESVVREIEGLGADIIFFVDDVFTHQPDRVAEICDLLIARKIRKHYVVNARAEIAKRPDVVRKMEQAGFIALLIGVESTQDATLKSMGKGFSTDQLRKWFAVLNKSKMILNAYFIAGNIGETEEQMLSTSSFARAIGADLILVSRLRNETHSPLSDLVERSPGYHIDADGFVYSDTCSTGQIAALRKRIDREFYTPLHVAAVIVKLFRVLNWRVLAKAAATIPLFLAQLAASQVSRKAGKWLEKRRVRRPALAQP